MQREEKWRRRRRRSEERTREEEEEKKEKERKRLEVRRGKKGTWKKGKNSNRKIKARKKRNYRRKN